MLVGQEWSWVWHSQPSAPCLSRESILNKREWGIYTRPVHTATLALLKIKRYFPQRTAIPWINVVAKTLCVNAAKMSSYWEFKNWFTTTFFPSSQPDPRSACDAARRCERTESTRHVLFLETHSWFIVLQGENKSAGKRAEFRGAAAVSSQRPEGMSRAWWHRKVPRAWGQSCPLCPWLTRQSQGSLSPTVGCQQSRDGGSAVLCQQLASCHSHPAQPWAAAED